MIISNKQINKTIIKKNLLCMDRLQNNIIIHYVIYYYMHCRTYISYVHWVFNYEEKRRFHSFNRCSSYSNTSSVCPTSRRDVTA